MIDKQAIRKKIQVISIIMLAVVAPGLVKVFASNAFDSVKPVDLVMLFASGVCLGVFLVNLLMYIKLKDIE